MIKFSILASGGSTKNITYLVKELRQNNLIASTEKDAGGDSVYLTHNIVAVKRIFEDYDGLMLDIHKEK